MIRFSAGLMISQEKYIMDLLHEVVMYNCKGTSTPMKYIIFFDSSCDDHLVDGSLCRRNIGKLYYFSFMRSYITFAITILFQAMHQHLCLIVLLL